MEKGIKTRSQYEYIDSEQKKVECKDWGVSKTVPNQSMDLHEVVERWINGQSVDGGRDVYYGEDNFDLSQQKGVDRIDIHNELIATNARIREQKLLDQKKLKDKTDSQKAKQTDEPPKAKQAKGQKGRSGADDEKPDGEASKSDSSNREAVEE